jgi:hypothetical protein
MRKDTKDKEILFGLWQSVQSVQSAYKRKVCRQMGISVIIITKNEARNMRDGESNLY